MIFTHREIVLTGSIVTTLLIGIGSRIVHTGFPVWDKYLGDALYAVLLYLLLSLFWGQGRPLKKAAICSILMLLIETFQLSHIPLQFWYSANPGLRALSVVLGTHFSWLDIVAYFVGILGIYLVDCIYSTQHVFADTARMDE